MQEIAGLRDASYDAKEGARQSRLSIRGPRPEQPAS